MAVRVCWSGAGFLELAWRCSQGKRFASALVSAEKPSRGQGKRSCRATEATCTPEAAAVAPYMQTIQQHHQQPLRCLQRAVFRAPQTHHLHTGKRWHTVGGERRHMLCAVPCSCMQRLLRPPALNAIYGSTPLFHPGGVYRSD